MTLARASEAWDGRPPGAGTHGEEEQRKSRESRNTHEDNKTHALDDALDSRRQHGDVTAAEAAAG